MDVKLTDQEKNKYESIYSQITGKYSKDDMELLENDDVAKHVLKTLIIRFILTGEMPTDFSVNYNTHLGMSNEVHYDATIPLEEKQADIEPEVILNNPNAVTIDYDKILSSLNIERTESNVNDISIQNE
jgi:hypothetical protein